MATKNDVTGQTIKTKPSSDKFRDNFDAIFRPKDNNKKKNKPVK